ncbi:uncharacterized protein LOC116247720 [Nymphaea colorata]|nr:uncharacterized protein LOC116247720 [Nymphaea colorata]
MEELYSKLYDKYQRLKTRKFSNLKHFNEEQNTKFLNYVSAAEEMIGHLKYENETLQTKINELKAQAEEKGSELVDLANKVSEYQNLLLEQNEKRNELAKEVDKLNSLLKLRYCESNYSGNVIPSMSPFNGLDISQRLEDSSTKEPSHILPESTSFKDDGKSFDKVDKCGLTKGSVAADPHDMDCLFQTLLECLVRMSFSSVKENDGLQLSVCHQLSGYSFSLSWIKKEREVTADDEVLYQVSSLGTIERIAPEWMREDLIFSTRMCPLFFERISQVIRLHN